MKKGLLLFLLFMIVLFSFSFIRAEVVCSSGSDCPTNEYAGTPYCGEGNNAYDTLTTYYCIYPGNEELSACKSNTQERVVEQCGEGELCSDGACVDDPSYSPPEEEEEDVESDEAENGGDSNSGGSGSGGSGGGGSDNSGGSGSDNSGESNTSDSDMTPDDSDEPLEIEVTANNSEEDTDVCNGCIFDSLCLDFGYRIAIDGNVSYCSINKTFEIQIDNSGSCLNDFECVSNECSNGQCISTYTLLERIAELFERIAHWFG